MYEIKIDNTGDIAELIITGQVTIQNISEIKIALWELYHNVNNLIIDHRHSENLDISYLQILISIKRSMEKDGKSISIKGGSAVPFVALLVDAGYPSTDWLIEEFEQNPREIKNE